MEKQTSSGVKKNQNNSRIGKNVHGRTEFTKTLKSFEILFKIFLLSLTGDAQPFPWPLPGDAYELNPDTGYPSDEDCSKYGWFTYYFTDAASKAYQSLYKDEFLLNAWSDFWRKTGQYFRDYSSVIGYELINEPWAGDVIKYDLSLFYYILIFFRSGSHCAIKCV